MKRTGNVRKFDDSVMTTPWNLNYGPMSNGQGSFEGSNIVKVVMDIMKNICSQSRT